MTRETTGNNQLHILINYLLSDHILKNQNNFRHGLNLFSLFAHKLSLENVAHSGTTDANDTGIGAISTGIILPLNRAMAWITLSFNFISISH